MAFFFGDGFDLYSAITDCGTYWDAAFGGGVTLALSPSGRFAGSRGVTVISGNSIPYMTKTSNVNDAVHHISLAVQSSLLSGASYGVWVTFYDGVNAQCTVGFRTDGALLLLSGNVAGGTLATYTGAIVGANTWYQFEIEVIISGTVGGMRVRKNGNTSNDYDSFISVGNLNTRAGSANNYANKIGLGASSTGGSQIADDFLWRSDASSVAWLGDIRCFTRMPASDSSVAWSRSGAPLITQTTAPGGSTPTVNNAVIRLAPYTIGYAGSISGITAVTAAGVTGNMKVAIWADSAGSPGAVLGSAGPQASVAAGNNVFTLSPPIAVLPGQRIWVGAINDTTAGTWTVGSSATGGATASGTYATFPQANPVPSVTNPLGGLITYLLPAGNYAQVAEPQQDGATTYVYSSTVSQSDLYTLQSISSTPASTVAVVTRGYVQKSDAGTRLAAVQLQSGATNVQATPLALPAGSWAWNWRTDLVDPATSAAWTATGVNNALIGAIVTG